VQRWELDIGWVWIFMSVIMILLLNLSGVVLVFSKSQILSGIQSPFIIEASTIAFIETVSRTIIALTITIGSYLLYQSIRGSHGIKFKLSPVFPVVEEGISDAPKFKMPPGYIYLLKESHGCRFMAVDVFIDLVMHNEAGLYITRKYPPKVRDELGLRKTPIFWLTRDRDYKFSLNPADMVSIIEVIRDFISKSERSVVFLEGIEYLIVQNDLDSVIKFIESLDDSISKTNSKVIISVDPSAIDEKGLHLLERELKEFIP
jgi:hypothetical protein